MLAKLTPSHIWQMVILFVAIQKYFRLKITLFLINLPYFVLYNYGKILVTRSFFYIAQFTLRRPKLGSLNCKSGYSDFALATNDFCTQ